MEKISTDVSNLIFIWIFTGVYYFSKIYFESSVFTIALGFSIGIILLSFIDKMMTKE